MFILDIQLWGLDRPIHIEGTQFTAMMCLKGLVVVFSERRQLKSLGCGDVRCMDCKQWRWLGMVDRNRAVSQLYASIIILIRQACPLVGPA